MQPYEPGPEKLYVVVRGDLPAGAQAAQAGHAIADFATQEIRAFLAWKNGANNLVILEAADEEELERLAFQVGDFWAVVRVREPDLNDSLTAFACREGAARFLSSLPLALKGYRRAT